MAKRHIILIALIAVLLAGVVVLAVVLTSNNAFIENITLKEDGVTRKDISKFSANGIHPGEDREYSIVLKSKISDTYIISLKFEQTQDSPLKDYIEVTVAHGEESYSYSLAELLDGDVEISFSLKIEAKAEEEIIITYSMPSDVGNEAQKATADFDIILTAERF